MSTRSITTAADLYAPGHLGELTQYVPFELVEDILTRSRRLQQRLRLLPSRVGVYFVLALALFPGLGYARVWDKLVAGLPGHLRLLPSARALGELRRRLGPAPFQELFEVLAGPLAPPHTPGVRYRCWRTVAFDGCSSVRVPDQPRLRAWLGKTRNQQGDAGYPSLRLTALCETGTRGLLAADFGPCTVGELASATSLLPALGPQMLLLADRAFDSDAFFGAVADTGAQYLIRLRSTRRPLIEKVLSDGSFLTHLDGRPVRIIDAVITATCTDGKQIGDSYRLATTLLDPVADPAPALVRLYHERWEIESAFYALRHTLQQGLVLRSRDAMGLRQELWAGLCVYQLLRRAMTDAALARPGTDPDRLSFTAALETARNQVGLAFGIDASTPEPTAPGTIGGAVLAAMMPKRRLRVSTRKVKCATSRYAARDGEWSATSKNITRLTIDVYDGHRAFSGGTAPVPPDGGPHPTTRTRRKEQVIQLMQNTPDRSWTAREIAYTLNLPKHTVMAGQLCQWALDGVLKRTSPGAYTLTPAWADPAHPGRAGHTAKERTLALLQTTPGRSWKAREILHALEFPESRHRSLVNELCRWVRQGILDRTGPGNYTLPQPAPTAA
ncbi:Transposase DDE domain-containing protein, partial [Streptomyces sp. di50b]